MADFHIDGGRRALIVTTLGIQIYTFNIHNIKILIKLGYKVDVAANFSDPGPIDPELIEKMKAELKSMGIGVYDLDFSRMLDRKDVVRSYKAISNFLKDKHYDLIHCQSPVAGAVTRLAAAKSRRNGTKIIYTAHGFHFFTGAPLKWWLTIFPAEIILSFFTDTLITINNEDFKRAKRFLWARKTIYIPGVGVDTEKFVPENIDKNEIRNQLGLSNDDVFLLSVGELSETKNHELVIRALAKIGDPKMHYYICGEGDHYFILEKLAKELNVNLHLLGFSDDVKKYYRSCDLLIHPSLREGLPVVLLEAISCETPIICSRVRGNMDLISDDSYRFDRYNVDELIKVLEEKLSCDNSEAIKNNLSVISKYDFKNIDKLMKKIYKLTAASK